MPPRLVEGGQHFVVAEDHQRAARRAGDAAPDSEDDLDGGVASLSGPNKLGTEAQEQAIQGEQVSRGCAAELGGRQRRLPAKSLSNADMEPDPTVERGNSRL